MIAELRTIDRRKNRPPRPLTERQGEVLWFVQDFTSRNGFAPTIREMCEGLGISSTNGAAEHIDALVRKGFVVRGKNKQRSVRVIRSANGSPVTCCPTCRRPR